jgi:hypothetical protein
MMMPRGIRRHRPRSISLPEPDSPQQSLQDVVKSFVAKRALGRRCCVAHKVQQGLFKEREKKSSRSLPWLGARHTLHPLSGASRWGTARLSVLLWLSAGHATRPTRRGMEAARQAPRSAFSLPHTRNKPKVGLAPASSRHKHNVDLYRYMYRYLLVNVDPWCTYRPVTISSPTQLPFSAQL